MGEAKAMMLFEPVTFQMTEELAGMFSVCMLSCPVCEVGALKKPEGTERVASPAGHTGTEIIGSGLMVIWMSVEVGETEGDVGSAVSLMRPERIELIPEGADTVTLVGA